MSFASKFEKGADVNIKNEGGKTLYWASKDAS